MNQNYKTLKYQISASNLELRHNTQPYTRLILNKNPTDAPMKLLHKRSVKEILPKYLHPNPDVDKEKLLYEIEKQHSKLRRQFSLKKNLEEKLSQKINSQNQPKLDLKTYSRTNSRKNTIMSRTFTSTSSQMHSLAQRSIQNEIKSINNQISALHVEKEKNDDKIFQIKHSQKFIRYVENHQEKLAFLDQFKKMKLSLKNLQLEIRNLKRAHMQKKKLKIQQLLMEDEIENSIEKENIQLYRFIEDIKEEIMNVASKKANMVMKKEKLTREIEEMKEMYQIPAEIVDQFYKSVEASKKWANYSSLSNSKVSSKKLQLSQKGTMKDEQDQNQQEEDNQSNSMTPKKAKYRQSFNHIQQQPQQSMDDTNKQQAQKRTQQRNTIKQLQKKYFQYQEKYEQDYQKEEQQQSDHEDEIKSENYEDDNEFESEGEELKEEENMGQDANEIEPIEHYQTPKRDQPDSNDIQDKIIHKSMRGMSF